MTRVAAGSRLQLINSAETMSVSAANFAAIFYLAKFISSPKKDHPERDLYSILKMAEKNQSEKILKLATFEIARGGGNGVEAQVTKFRPNFRDRKFCLKLIFSIYSRRWLQTRGIIFLPSKWSVFFFFEIQNKKPVSSPRRRHFFGENAKYSDFLRRICDYSGHVLRMRIFAKFCNIDSPRR